MDLSIIIPSYNTKNLLDRCLKSIEKSLKDSKVRYEVLVIDNASKDGSARLVEEKYPDVILIQSRENLGYGKSNNLGIRKAKGEHILLLNSDIQVLGSAIEDLYACMKGKDRVFAGGKLLNEDLSPQASCGPAYSLPVVFLMLFCKGDTLGITRSSPESLCQTDWVSGACVLGKKDAFIDVGLFDERIFLYMEEIDLFYRAKKKGYTVLFCPEARFIHTGAASSASRRTPVINIYRGLTYFYGKHRSKQEQKVLQYMVYLKARAAIFAAGILGRTDIKKTYEEALSILH